MDETCVLLALAREALFLRPRASRRLRQGPCPAWLGQSPAGPLLLVQSGMGAQAALRALDWALQRRPGRVVVAGFCGGLDERLEVGALLQPDEVCDEHGTTWPVPPAPRIGLAGRLVSVDRPVLGAAGRQALRGGSGAAAVDLEAAAAVGLLRQRGIPFACLKAVSDDVRHGLPEDLAAALDGERVRPGRLLRAVVVRPGLLAELWRLARDSRLAARRLADGVGRLLLTWRQAWPT